MPQIGRLNSTGINSRFSTLTVTAISPQPGYFPIVRSNSGQITGVQFYSANPNQGGVLLFEKTINRTDGIITSVTYTDYLRFPVLVTTKTVIRTDTTLTATEVTDGTSLPSANLNLDFTSADNAITLYGVFYA